MLARVTDSARTLEYLVFAMQKRQLQCYSSPRLILTTNVANANSTYQTSISLDVKRPRQLQCYSSSQ